jgi:potassium efflux system protein
LIESGTAQLSEFAPFFSRELLMIDFFFRVFRRPKGPSVTTRRDLRRPSVVAALFAFILIVAAGAALAVEEPLRTARERLDAIRGQFDLVEAVLDRPDNRSRGLSALREQIEPLRAELRQIVGTLEPLHGQIDSRVKQLGAPPAEGQPPEAPQVMAERQIQTEQLRDVDAALKQTRLHAVRGDQIAERIDQQRRTSFANRFFARTDSPFNPDLWLQAASVVPRETGKIATHLVEWQEHLASRPTSLLVLALVFTCAALGAILLTRRFVRRRIYTAQPPAGETPLLPRSNKALFGLRDTVLDALTAPAAVFAVVQIFGALGLLTDRIELIGSRLVSAVFFVAIGRALANAVLAPGRAHCRLPRLSEDAARHLYNPIASAVLITGAFLFVSGVNRALRIDAALSISASALYAGIVAIVLAYSLIVSRNASEDREDGMPPWLRLTGWVAVVAITTALAAGYVRFGSLIAERLVTAAVVLLALYLVLAIIDAVLGEGLTRDSPRRRALANTVGLRPKTLDLFAALFAGLLRALSVLIALFIVVGTLTTSTIDLAGLLDSALLGVPVGQTRVSVVDILIAVTIFLVGLLITRILYHWLSATVLPRTELESSLQNSVATIFGYAGIIIAVALALARLGVNLENIALVAGALSIGIGFGLQSVVSNFVSGLILLTERPIRVGDWILAKGEEGYVRKISVRSTEIETSERAKVVLPNSDLITGVVKNWISADKLRQFTIAVGVSYDADPDNVRELLLGVAGENARVAKHPAPSVLFVRFGESALEFELRGSVTDTDQRLGTMSDLHFGIFRRFREAGIHIPYPQRDIHIRSAPGGDDMEKEEAAPPRKSR